MGQLTDRVYLRNPSANVSADYQLPLLAEYGLTYQLIVDQYLANNDGRHWSAGCWLTYWPRLILGLIVPSVDRISVDISIEYRLICRPTLSRFVRWYTGQHTEYQSTYRPMHNRHVDRHSTVRRASVDRYVYRVSADMSTDGCLKYTWSQLTWT